MKVRSYESSDPRVKHYVNAKRFIFAGDYAKAATALEDFRSGVDDATMRNLASYWLARCCGEMGDDDRASNHLHRSVGEFQFRLQPRRFDRKPEEPSYLLLDSEKNHPERLQGTLFRHP
ncbi:MAG: hypothetical protein U5N86_00995 [Planctomycetota bacterium]|nr:hypothetical protein [Planctomycetota bacterium]